MIAVIIQARMGSTRLPGKSLMDLCGKPLIMRVVERAKLSKLASQVVLATTTDKRDDALAAFARQNGVPCFRGSVDDVLDRYYRAAKEFDASVVVRITGDCPLIDPKLIDESIALLRREKCDYAGNASEPWMDGFDVEVFTFKALEKAWKNASMASEREHVTPYIRNNPAFKKCFLENDSRLKGAHCSVDTRQDLNFVRAVYAKLSKKNFGYKDVIALLEKQPELLKMNAGSIVNAGYAKSLREDKKVR